MRNYIFRFNEFLSPLILPLYTVIKVKEKNINDDKKDLKNCE